MKRAMHLILFLTLITSLIGCGEGFKSDDEKEPPEENTPAVLSENVENDHKYELEVYVFDSKKVLLDELNINAKKVIFLAGAELVINEFDVNITSKFVEFNSGVKIIGFEEFNYNGCFAHGKNSGNIFIETESISGSPNIELSGQDAGLAGMYLKASSKKKLRSSHTPSKSGEFYLNECLRNFNGYPKDMGKYNKSYNGGSAGRFSITHLPGDSFSPFIGSRRSHGSYKAYVDWLAKKTSGFITNEKGRDGSTTLICYQVSGEELCQ